jgi:hypothetical protein
MFLFKPVSQDITGTMCGIPEMNSVKLHTKFYTRPGWTASLQRSILSLRPRYRTPTHEHSHSHAVRQSTVRSSDGGGPITWPPKPARLEVSRFPCMAVRTGQCALLALHRRGKPTAITAAVLTQIALRLLHESLEGMNFPSLFCTRGDPKCPTFVH